MLISANRRNSPSDAYDRNKLNCEKATLLYENILAFSHLNVNSKIKKSNQPNG